MVSQTAKGAIDKRLKKKNGNRYSGIDTFSTFNSQFSILHINSLLL